MPLAPGHSLSFYEILGPLGAGGMGEVYRARDTRLEREVAVKVLPEELADDEERLRRFDREAKTLASLNHPNVAHVYGIDQVDETCFMAMELVPGEDLSERLARGRLSLEEAIDVARQIAEGLEAAHEMGVVHRDLKPANVRITPEGVVKLLDFGLAKPLIEKTSGTSFTARPDSFLVTEEGMLLGTPTYMSPEQARGRPVDRRTDIWAFGCVLYECLTGKRAFDGESLSDVIAAVLNTEPDLAKLPAATPAAVRDVVRRCLVKDARRRLRDAGDARIALEESDAGAAAPAASRSRAQPLLLGLCAVVALASGWTLGSRGGGEGAPGPDVLPAFFRQVSDLPGAERQPSLSPDGKSVLYVHKTSVENADIFLQRVEGRTPINLTSDSPANDSAPAFSPDGERIAFRSGRSGGGIFVMGATGESVRRLTDFGFDPAWSPDGSHLAVTTEPVEDPLNREYISELWIVSADGSEKRRLAEGEDVVGARWSPDGKRIAYWGWREPDWQRDVRTIASDGSESSGVLVTDDAPVDWSPAWAHDGTGLYFASNRGGTMNLWRVELDAAGRPLSAPLPVTTPAAWSGGYSLSADGRRIAYATRDLQAEVFTYDLDPEAGEVVSEPAHIFGGRAITDLDWSPEADRLVLAQSGDPWESLAIIRADGSGYTRITDASIQHRGLGWRPVGGSELILFYSNANLMTIHSDGSNARLVEPGVRAFGGCWSIDGSQVLTNDVNEDWNIESFVKYELRDDETFRRIDWEGVQIPLPGLNGLVAWTSTGELSLVPGTALEPGLFEIDMNTGDMRRLVDAARGDPTAARFLPDGKRFLYRLGNRVLRFDTETLEQAVVLEFEHDLTLGSSGGLSLSRDGRKLALLSPRDEGDIWLMELEAVEAD